MNCKTLIIGLTLLLGTVSLQAKSLPDLAQFLQERVIRIHMTGPRGYHTPPDGWHSCSAFGIDAARGWGITAQHCVQNAEGVHYAFVVDDFHRPLRVVATAEQVGFIDDDLALLHGDIFTELDPLQQMTLIPPAGTQVVAGGYAEGNHKIWFGAFVLSRIDEIDTTFRLQGGVIGGMSGGPVLNQDGQVIGVLVEGDGLQTKAIAAWHFQELKQFAARDASGG